jgi:hypothetical protein
MNNDIVNDWLYADLDELIDFDYGVTEQQP